MYHFPVHKRMLYDKGAPLVGRFSFSLENGPRYSDIGQLVDSYMRKPGILPTVLSRPALRA